MKLISLCASHICSEQRLGHFKLMLDSWKSQTQQIELFVSLSTDVMKVSELKKKLLMLYPEGLYIYESEPKLSQFRHYERLVHLLPVKKRRGAWVLFTDDDDLWHPQRVEWYKSLLKSTKDLQKLDQCTHITIPTHTIAGGDHMKVKDIGDWKNMETMTHPKDMDYISICCRLVHLKNFVTETPSVILDHFLCDMAFSAHLQLDNFFGNVTCPLETAVYFWRKDESYSHSRLDRTRNDKKKLEINAINFVICHRNATLEECVSHVLKISGCNSIEDKFFIKWCKSYLTSFWNDENLVLWKKIPSVDMTCINGSKPISKEEEGSSYRLECTQYSPWMSDSLLKQKLSEVGEI